MAAEVTVTFNESGMNALLERPDGPLGRYIDTRARRLMIRVLNRAGGGRPGPEIRSGDLLRHTTYDGLTIDRGAIQATISSSARHNGVNYPRLLETGFLSRRGKRLEYPFLVPAMKDEFGPSVV